MANAQIKIEDLPQKGTFGTGEPLADLPETEIAIRPKTELPPSVGVLPPGPGSPGIQDHPFQFHPGTAPSSGSHGGMKEEIGDGGVNDVGIPIWADSHYYGSPGPKGSRSDTKK